MAVIFRSLLPVNAIVTASTGKDGIPYIAGCCRSNVQVLGHQCVLARECA